MCGILGLAATDDAKVDYHELFTLFETLLIQSESRGKEASGIAISYNEETKIIKSALPSSKLINQAKYLNLKNGILHSNKKFPLIAIGHSRLATNGKASLNKNNQPVQTNSFVGVHNGIIANVDELNQQFKLNLESELDTEFFFKLISKYNQELGFDLALKKSYAAISGSASCAFLDSSNNLSLSTNNGSIYYSKIPNLGLFIFASENFILKKVLNKLSKFHTFIEDYEVKKLDPNKYLSIGLNDANSFDITHGSLEDSSEVCNQKSLMQIIPDSVYDISDRDYPDYELLKRCTKCLLPHTFPYIEFDSSGVCNYCKNHRAQGHRDHERIKELVKDFPKSPNTHGQNCIVGLSGGRDSCYGLHYLKKELNLNPIAFTYDWGLVTDLARRNIF